MHAEHEPAEMDPADLHEWHENMAACGEAAPSGYRCTLDTGHDMPHRASGGAEDNSPVTATWDDDRSTDGA